MLAIIGCQMTPIVNVVLMMVVMVDMRALIRVNLLSLVSQCNAQIQSRILGMVQYFAP